MKETDWLWWLSVAEKRLHPDTLFQALKAATLDYWVAVRDVPVNMRRTNAHIEQHKRKVKKLENLVENPWGANSQQPGQSLNLVR